jgi:hypothetical protein
MMMPKSGMTIEPTMMPIFIPCETSPAPPVVGTGAEYVEGAGDSRVAHLPQNLASAGLSWPHLGHSIYTSVNCGLLEPLFVQELCWVPV